MIHAFRLLKNFRWIRGTPLDVFSYSEERRNEHSLITRYFNTVGQLLVKLSPENLELAVRIATLPDDIRGFGHVKESSTREVTAKWDTLLSQYATDAYSEPQIVRLVDPGQSERRTVAHS